MTDITVEIDGLPVEVDEAEYTADPDRVVATVREARFAIAGSLDDEPAPDFDELEAVAAVFGSVDE